MYRVDSGLSLSPQSLGGENAEITEKDLFPDRHEIGSGTSPSISDNPPNPPLKTGDSHYSPFSQKGFSCSPLSQRGVRGDSLRLCDVYAALLYSMRMFYKVSVR